MAWIIPKTDWKNGDFFNVADYNRIKGDIEYVYALTLTRFPEYTIHTLSTISVNSFPTEEFFNNIVYAIQDIMANCYQPPNAKSMRTYAANGVVWDADDLNTIENNILILQMAFDDSVRVRKLTLKLGGVRIGD